MGFLKKIRSNILNQDNSFHVGFGNRSPFSYTGQYSGDWTPVVPEIETPKPISQIPVLEAEIDLVGKVADAAVKVAKAGIKYHKAEDPNKKVKKLEKKYDRLSDRTDKAYAKNTKKGDKRGNKLYDKAEELMREHNIKFPWER